MNNVATLLASASVIAAIITGIVAFFKLRPENRKTNTDSVSVLVETSGQAVLIWKGIVEERDDRIERAEGRIHDLETQVADLIAAGKAQGQAAEARVDQLSARVEVLENELSSHGIPIPPTTEDSPDLG